ncbi:alpha-ketoacid dehydrogenase subunit beta [Alkaliphilus hydrothermalis]|uniref:Pyruvate dehydrogenase E1 component beta subunit n=1 Tax=Alkaliphilus hydrothermalis TaxID=1482730 RepID=A0ABS2NTV1_9FIRM|nr:alpha-ketoacid dehydrogenase subunit beta [Alkaliphilus hydrothermalis]MBM7616372.1 pyruvate dehydrogenase E1 component beta subunit [Alkaliphilus hydrothermalis]
MPLLNNISAINQALDQEMERDQSVVVYGEDVGYEGGVFRATVGLQKKYGEKRCFDTPLAEAGIVGSAVGMAINGMKPVVEMQFSGFVLPALNQIIGHVARFRNRTRGKYHLPMVIRMPYGGGVRALEHHSESIEDIFAQTPGLKVVIPSTPYDSKGLLLAAIRDPDPVIFLEPKRIYRAFKQEVPEEDYIIPIGKAKIVKEGTDITVVTWGALVREAQKAAKVLEEKGVNIELIDLRTISPLDKGTIIDSVQKTGRFLVIHEAYKSFGPGAELISIVNEGAFLYLEAPPARLTGFDVTVPLPMGEHHFIITPEQIVDKVMEIVSY